MTRDQVLEVLPKMSAAFASRVRPALLLTAALAAAATTAAAGEAIPAGPPWSESFREVRRDALREGKPVFVYFTKTY